MMTVDPLIGIAGPISLPLLDAHLPRAPDAPDGMGGIPVTHLVQGLLDAGERVSVYTLAPTVSTPITLRGERLTVYVGPFRKQRRMRDFMRQERQHIQAFVRRDAPALVHAHWTYEYALGALATDRPTITTVHDWAPEILAQQRDAYRFGRLLMSAATLLKGRHFIANSPYIQDRLQRWVRSPVPVIPNAVNEALFRAPDRPSPEQPPVLVSVNNGFGRRKNVKTLLRAFSSIRGSIPGCRLRLVGAWYEPDGPAAAWADKHQLAEGVTFLGPLPYEQTINEIRSASLLVHPALEESFGMTLLEAMAVGTPVVAGAESGAVPWVTGDGAAALLTDVTRPAPLATAVCGLLGDAARWAALAETAHQHAWSHFRLSAVVKRHLEAYHTLLNPDERSRSEAPVSTPS